MKKNILNKGILVLLLLTAFGCRTRKLTPVVVAPASAAEKITMLNKSEVLKQASGKQASFNTIHLKAKADLNINKNSNTVTMNIRMQKEKLIWISVSAPIIGEVARALITPDSIKIINKFESSYTRKPFSYIYQFTSKQVDFKTLQDIFVGNAMMGALSLSSQIDVNGEQTHIKGLLSDLAYLLIFNSNYNLIQSNLSDEKASQSLTVNYGDYKNIGEQEIPSAISIKSAAANKNIGMDLQYTYVGLNESLDFPFSVPKRYTVKD